MSAAVSRLLSGCLLLAAGVTTAAAGTLTGTVRNATTGKPGAGLDVILIQLQGGMEAVATTKADAQGRYRFDRPEIGQQPLLVRVSYRGVNYHQSVSPGRDTADVEVFESTTASGVLQVTSYMMFVRPNGSVLQVDEGYVIRNQSQPPAAFFNPKGTFEFQIPEVTGHLDLSLSGLGKLGQVSARGPSGMPVVQGTIEKGKGRYAIATAFRPGETSVQVTYEFPYSASQATIRVQPLYPAPRVLVAAPAGVQVAGEGFEPAGNEQGWNLYAHDAVTAGSSFEVSISGTASAPAADEAQDSSAPGGAQGVRVMPGRLDSVKWVLLGGLGALFVLGLILVWRRPARDAVSKATAELDREVRHNLDEIKEALFRLELRKQAGTISAEEYARERGRAEKLLRELVKG